MAKNLFLKIIKIYQITMSPDHGIFKRVFYFSRCRFYPSCSSYTYEAINKYGIWGGFLKGLKRLVRCHPFNQGGYDPPK